MMDLLIRGFTFCAAGFVLLLANVWFVKMLYNQYWKPEYVISPFQVLDPTGSVPESAGLTIAQITASRLSNLQAQLKSARETDDTSSGAFAASEDNLFGDLQDLLHATPNWPELIFLAGSTSHRIGNLGNAGKHFRKLATMPDEQRGEANPQIFDIAVAQMAELSDLPSVPSGETQEKYVEAAAEFALQMNLPGPDPKIVFMEEHRVGGQLGQWSESDGHYEVYPAGMEFKGLPQYIALMGRFFERNFDRCFNGSGPKPDTQFWQEFRYAVVDYLIQSNPEFSEVVTIGQNYALFNALKEIEIAAGKKAAQRLGLAMLDFFECDWAQDTLVEHLREINKQQGLMDESIIIAAMKKIEQTL